MMLGVVFNFGYSTVDGRIGNCYDISFFTDMNEQVFTDVIFNISLSSVALAEDIKCVNTFSNFPTHSGNEVIVALAGLENSSHKSTIPVRKKFYQTSMDCSALCVCARSPYE